MTFDLYGFLFIITLFYLFFCNHKVIPYKSDEEENELDIDIDIDDIIR